MTPSPPPSAPAASSARTLRFVVRCNSWRACLFLPHLQSCFKVEGDCDEFTYEEVEGECTIVKSDASVARVAFLAIVAVVIALMW